MKLVIAMAFITALPTIVLSQEVTDSVLPEASFDVDLSNLRSPGELETMLADAKSALDAEGCDSAESQFAIVSLQANATANILRAGNEPFYDAALDDRKAFSRSSAAMNPLIDAENKMNRALKFRNEAWVREGICKLEAGDVEGGVALLNKSLKYISLRDEPETWKLARESMWALVAEASPDTD